MESHWFIDRICVCVIKGVADEFTDTRLIFVAWKLFRHS